MAALATIGLLASSVAWAATPVGSSGTSLLPADLGFVLHAAEGGNAEIALGKLASEKATDDNIMQFGHQMAMDHSMANKELAGIATSKGVVPPEKPGATAQAIMQALDAAPKASFNRDYMSQQVSDHITTLALFQHCAESCEDAEIKGFAAKHVPDIQNHLKMAQELLGKAKQQASAQ